MTNVTPAPDSAGLAERLPLSYAQQMLCVFDAGETETGPFGPKHNIAWGWRLEGVLDRDAFTAALADVVAKHETLRTRIVRDDGDPYQSVAAPSPAPVIEVDLGDVPAGERDDRAEEWMVELEAGSYGIEPLPLVRAYLGKFDATDTALVLIAHHSAVDGWSMQVIARDLFTAYARRRGHSVPETPEPAQYRDFVVHQLGPDGVTAQAQDYWKRKLEGAQILTQKMDFPRSQNLPVNTAVLRYPIETEVANGVATLARATRSSPFMVLLAAYDVMLARRSGLTDVVVPTIGSNRKETRFQETVGNFTNFMALRTDLSGCETFLDAIARTRTTCIEAYRWEIPFLAVIGQNPALMAGAGLDDECLVAFQVMQLPYDLENETVGELKVHDIPRQLSQEVYTEIPDGALWQFNVTSAGLIKAYLGYNTHKFSAETMKALAEEFSKTLGDLVIDPEAPLDLGKAQS